MELFEMSVWAIAFFVGFGLLVGVLFGFFGMGGSFLATPALLVLGDPAPVAVGSGLAFVFGTAVNGGLRHRALGQVDYRLAGLLVVGMTTGVWFGNQTVLRLVHLGSADLAISMLYTGLLGAIGLCVLRDARTGVAAGPLGIQSTLPTLELPPMVSLIGGMTVSVWFILVGGLVVGFLSGVLGVGGGFMLLPLMIYGFGVHPALAVGTDILPIVLSSAFGTFIYAHSNAVDLPVVAAMLAGSALGARIGASATRLVDDADFKGYFALTLLAGSVAVAGKQMGMVTDIPAMGNVSAVLIFGAVCLVSGAIVRTAVVTLREHRERSPPIIH